MALILALCWLLKQTSWVGKIHLRRDRLPTPVFLGFLCRSAGRESPAMWETWVQSLGWEDSLERKRLPTPVFWLENSMDYTVHGRKVMTILDSILKSRDSTLTTKFHLVKAMVFPVVMYGCESRTIKKLNAEELMLLNCGVGEDSWESLGLQRNPTSPS